MYKVLIIDDEYYIREGMKQSIPWEEMGCMVVGEAVDGEEGIEKILALAPDIILSDIRMPKKSGLEMIAEIHSIDRRIKIIILTGFREFEYAQQAIRLGVMRFLLKPSKLEEIKEAIGEAVLQLEREGDKAIVRDDIKDSGEDNEKPQYLAKQAVLYINEHYSSKLDLQTVADVLFVSTWYLCKLLKKQTGKSFVELLNSARIDEAKKLLVESNMKIYEIAEYVGYTDTAYFSKVFKKITQKTPNDFRNKMY